MTTLVSLLRGVNVGGQKKLRMSALGELYESLGFSDVRTYIQSGNVVFSAFNRKESALGEQIEKGLQDRFGIDVKVFIRSTREVARVVERNPFAEKEPNRVHVTFLHSKPIHIPDDAINAAKAEDEKFSIRDQEVYLFLPNGMGRSKLSNSFFEKVLKVPATTRNWNTVKALLHIATAREE